MGVDNDDANDDAMADKAVCQCLHNAESASIAEWGVSHGCSQDKTQMKHVKIR